MFFMTCLRAATACYICKNTVCAEVLRGFVRGRSLADVLLPCAQTHLRCEQVERAEDSREKQDADEDAKESAMIVRPRLRGWELFSVTRLSIIPRIAPQIAVLSAFSLAVVWMHHLFPGTFRNLTVAPFTLLGIALSIFLGFRNGACYDRWWEARRQLGSLLGESRSLARLALTLHSGDRGRRERVVRGTIGYAYALMAHLRGSAPFEEVRRYLPGWESEPARNAPDAILRRLAGELAAMLAEGEIGELLYQRFEERLVAIAAIQSACERIKTTPTPFAYSLLLHRTAYAFCFLLPFGLVSTVGWATPVLCAVIAYTFFGLDAVGDELEEPFGEWLNALPMQALARTIEISLLEALGEPEIPPMLMPVDSVLR
jgi:putative membrane protein